MDTPRPVATVFATIALSCSPPALHAGDVLLNEWNVVSASKFIKGADATLGRVQGNGGNWLELIVVGDHVDMRGWQLQWAEIGGGDPTDGTDFWIGSGAINQGVVNFTQSPVWAGLRSGTIITIAEDFVIRDGAGATVANGSDLSFDPAADDWWIHVCTFANATLTEAETELVSAVSNITTDRLGSFKVGKANWIARLVDSSGNEVQGRTGEGATSWRGAGISNEEGGSLRGPGAGATVADWVTISPSSSLYQDTDATSFGQPNVSFNSSTSRFTTIQDVTALRALGSTGGGLAPPTITAVSMVGDDLSITWTSSAEQRFEVQTSTDLENWSVAPGGPVAAENSADETSATVSVPVGGAYVRVRRL